MTRLVSDLPPLLAPGLHPVTINRLIVICVEAFPFSNSRAAIMYGFQLIVCQLVALGIIGDIVVDGSFLTEEIEPEDIDFALCVTPDFYESCSALQRSFLEWIRDDFSIKRTHHCDCYLCIEYPQWHGEFFEGIQNRAFWINLFAESVIYKQSRGVAIIQIDGEVL